MATLTRGSEQYAPDEIIVALPDLGEVQRELGQLGLQADQIIDAHERLGLALLALPELDEHTRRLRQDPDLIRAASAAWPGVDARAQVDQMPDLDLLMFAVRARFRDRFGGWVPTMGKNRAVHNPGLEGFPHISGGGQGDPTPASGPDTPWPLRRSEPGAGVQVGLLDTKLWLHPWLAGGYASAADALIMPGDGDDAYGTYLATAGHATFVAGRILDRAPGARLEVRPVLNDQSIGDVWNAAKHIADLAASGVNVLNLSLGCFTGDGDPPLALATAIGRVSPETVVVAAAGNYDEADIREGLTRTTPMWPAALDDVVAVGASDSNGDHAQFSPDLPWVNFLAPGVGVESTYLTGRIGRIGAGSQDVQTNATSDEFTGWANWSGTSFAAASVSGAIAARIKPGHRTAREALDDLRSGRPAGLDKDIIPLR
jgi:membrane-anchored mycosin MYCP